MRCIGLGLDFILKAGNSEGLGTWVESAGPPRTSFRSIFPGEDPQRRYKWCFGKSKWMSCQRAECLFKFFISSEYTIISGILGKEADSQRTSFSSSMSSAHTAQGGHPKLHSVQVGELLRHLDSDCAQLRRSRTTICNNDDPNLGDETSHPRGNRRPGGRDLCAWPSTRYPLSCCQQTPTEHIPHRAMQVPNTPSIVSAVEVVDFGPFLDGSDKKGVADAILNSFK